MCSVQFESEEEKMVGILECSFPHKLSSLMDENKNQHVRMVVWDYY